MKFSYSSGCGSLCSETITIVISKIPKITDGQVWWFRPIVPATWEAKVEDCLSSGDQDKLGQYGETLSLPKIHKIRKAWWCTPIVPANQEAEVGGWQEPGRQRLQ